jgi:hypothetical protein
MIKEEEPSLGIDQPASSSSVSEQRFKFLLGDLRLFEYVGQCGSFDGTVHRNDQFDHFPRVCLCRRIWLPLWRMITHPSR